MLLAATRAPCIHRSLGALLSKNSEALRSIKKPSATPSESFIICRSLPQCRCYRTQPSVQVCEVWRINCIRANEPLLCTLQCSPKIIGQEDGCIAQSLYGKDKCRVVHKRIKCDVSAGLKWSCQIDNNKLQTLNAQRIHLQISHPKYAKLWERTGLTKEYAANVAKVFLH